MYTIMLVFWVYRLIHQSALVYWLLCIFKRHHISLMLGYLHDYLVTGKIYGYFAASYLGITSKACGILAAHLLSYCLLVIRTSGRIYLMLNQNYLTTICMFSVHAICIIYKGLSEHLNSGIIYNTMKRTIVSKTSETSLIVHTSCQTKKININYWKTGEYKYKCNSMPKIVYTLKYI